MVLIKISEVPSSRKALLERVIKYWKIKLETICDQNTVIATHKGEIVSVYKILGGMIAPHNPGRIEFKLEEIESDLKGKRIVSKTSNPCTILSELNFKDL